FYIILYPHSKPPFHKPRQSKARPKPARIPLLRGSSPLRVVIPKAWLRLNRPFRQQTSSQRSDLWWHSVRRRPAVRGATSGVSAPSPCRRGPSVRPVMFVGEQPGDQEGQAGRSLVRP